MDRCERRTEKSVSKRAMSYASFSPINHWCNSFLVVAILDEDFHNIPDSDEDMSFHDSGCNFNDDDANEDHIHESTENNVNDIIENMTLDEAIRYWVLKTNQDHVSIQLIMDIIRRKTGRALPRSARTLLRTTR